MPEPGSQEQGAQFLRATYPTIDAFRHWIHTQQATRSGIVVPTRFGYHFDSLPTVDALTGLEESSPDTQAKHIAGMLGVLPILHIVQDHLANRSMLSELSHVNTGRAALISYFSEAGNVLPGGDPEVVAPALRYRNQAQGFYEAYMQDKPPAPQVVFAHGGIVRGLLPPVVGENAYNELFGASAEVKVRDFERFNRLVYDYDPRKGHIVAPSYTKAINTLTLFM